MNITQSHLVSTAMSLPSNSRQVAPIEKAPAFSIAADVAQEKTLIAGAARASFAEESGTFNRLMRGATIPVDADLKARVVAILETRIEELLQAKKFDYALTSQHFLALTQADKFDAEQLRTYLLTA